MRDISGQKGISPMPVSMPEKPPVVREYTVGGTRYIVTAMENPCAKEDAAVKVRRLIRNEITGLEGKAVRG
ncbi:MAG: transposon-encoded TnpW family protein [Oscillospiraceae bacterium]|nr:transposon-encoded TnpW family protein [Oscillospiraceae bacterium]